MKKNSFFTEIGKPFIVLVVICIVASALLGFTNDMTAPIIEENARLAAEQTRKEVLPEATSFVQLDVDPSMNVDSIYQDEGGNGYVITASSKGYGGNVVVTIGFNADGEIVGMSADVSTETQGVGSKAGKEDHLAKYIGLSEPTEDPGLLITSATFSSKAMRTAVNNAMAALAAIQ